MRNPTQQQTGRVPAESERGLARSAESPAAKPEEEIEDALLAAAPYSFLVLALLAGLIGAAAVAVLRPEWIAALMASLGGAMPKAYWYLSRSSAMVAYVMLWASMALGLAITNKLLRAWPGGPTLAALHEYVSLLGLAFALFHALILLWDGYSKYTPEQILIPFASTDYRPLWVGLGQIAFYLLLPVTFSFYARRWMSYRFWHQIHTLSYGVFLLALAHGLLSGSDSGATWVRDLYWASAVSLAGLTIYRVTVVRQLAPQ